PLSFPVSAFSRLRFFFFQAEDGIRDFHVTGVQTCALPIYRHLGQASQLRSAKAAFAGDDLVALAAAAGNDRTHQDRLQQALRLRSEERRVGKECRSRWSADRYKRKEIRSNSQRCTQERWRQ